MPYDDWNGLAVLQQAGLAVLLKGIVSDEMLQTYPLARKISADIFDNPALFTAFFSDLGLITIWKEVNALGTAFHQVRKDPSFLNRFKGIVNDGNLNKHLFEGDLKFENGSIRGISGVHSKEAITVPEGYTGSFAQGDVRFKSGTKDPINPKPYEYYTAKVEVMGKKYDAQGNPYDGWHSKKSTFFPDGWSKKKVQAEIAYGFQNKQFVRTQNNGAQIFHGEMTDGTTIEIVMNNGMIISAYPNLNVQ